MGKPCSMWDGKNMKEAVGKVRTKEMITREEVKDILFPKSTLSDKLRGFTENKYAYVEVKQRLGFVKIFFKNLQTPGTEKGRENDFSPFARRQPCLILKRSWLLSNIQANSSKMAGGNF
ncbi:hypothetical protein NPIL_165631 [Nephila pilipes]|uniref:Uncharacterized protein n=1 Tax=Nephila pilipes TaxID=299642 RepID=A0A8X6U7A9_NEPPI|nr:hypothetical protein NPIL_165631 [Nephila pilipes]